MWLATEIGWFSVVIDSQHGDDRMLIRARCKADIYNLFDLYRRDLTSMEPPTSDESRDYRWRMSISRREWISLAAKLASNIDYSNFKDVVHQRPDQGNKSTAYARIWGTMMDVQITENHGALEHDDALQAMIDGLDAKPCATPPDETAEAQG
jgi:hypothetical protein